MPQLPLLKIRAFIALLLLCLTVGQLAATKHSIDHLYHDNVAYCDSLALLENSEAVVITAAGVIVQCANSLSVGHYDEQVFQIHFQRYQSRAPPLYPLS